MRPGNKLIATVCVSALVLCAFNLTALGQKDAGKGQEAGDVLKINTELVQMGVYL